VVALRMGDVALLPVRDVLSIVDIAAEVSAAGAVQFVRPRDGARIRVQTDPLALVIGRTTRPVDARRLVVRDSVALLDAALVGEILGARVTVSWASLAVEIAEGDSLPPVAAAKRARLHEQLLSPPPPLRSVDESRPLSRALLTGGTLDYLVSVPDRRSLRTGSYVQSVGASIAGGAFEALVAGDLGGQRVDHTASWLGVWRGQAWLAQARVGDGVSTGPRGQLLRGVSVTNAPFLRSLDYGVIPVRAAGDSAWQVESFVNGRLVRVDTLRGAGDAIPVAARYGGNVIDLIARGPGGALQRTERFVTLTAEEFLPVGRWEYGLSAGECRVTSCDAVGNADVRVGLTRQFTARVGGEWQRATRHGDVARPYGSVSWLAHPTLTATGFMLGGSEASAVVRWQPTLDRALLVERTSTARADPFAVTDGLGAQERLNTTFFWRPDRWNDAVFVNGLWRAERGDAGTSARGRLAVGVRSRVGQWFPYVQYEEDAPTATASRVRRAAGISLFTTPSPRWGPALSRLWGYVSADWSDDRSRSASVTLAQSISDALRVEVTATGATAARPVFALRMYTDLPRARVVSTAQVDGARGYEGTHQIQGALFFDAPRRAVGAARGPLLLRGAVGGRVFLDLDGDGAMGRDELPLSGVSVRVGAATATTDAAGWYRVWDVLPFEPVRVEVEALTLESPLWVPAFGGLEVEPTPNSVRRVDVPVLSGGIVEGRVVTRVTSDSTVGVPGLEVQLVSGDGARTYRATTFSDGGFVLLGLAPGVYRAVFDAGAWAVQRESVIEVRRVPDGDRVRGVEIVVERRRSPE
jgi:hypothetical protein